MGSVSDTCVSCLSQEFELISKNILVCQICFSIKILSEVKMAHDPVNHPEHYTSSNAKCTGCGKQIECIDIVRHLGFNIGNAIKYLWRYKHKNGIEDLKKSYWYIRDEIHSMNGESKNEK